MDKKLFIKMALLIVAVTFIVSGAVFAKSLPSIEGTIQGANCVVNKTTCPVNGDVHAALEHDFVLLTANGDYYFLPNIDRALKVEFLSENVKISGDIKNHSVVVADIAVKTKNGYDSIWNWAEIVESMEGN